MISLGMVTIETSFQSHNVQAHEASAKAGRIVDGDGCTSSCSAACKAVGQHMLAAQPHHPLKMKGSRAGSARSIGPAGRDTAFLGDSHAEHTE